MFMKKMAICLAALLYMAANAQNFWDEFRAKSIDVEGMKIGHKMTYDKFVAKFGKPTEYTQSDSDSGEDGTPTLDNITGLGKMCFILGIMGVFVDFP